MRATRGRRRLWLSAVLVVAFSAASAPGLLRLRLERSLTALLPADRPSASTARDLARNVGATARVVVFVRSSRPELVEATLPELASRLSDSEAVRRVTYKREIEFFRSRALYFLDAAELRELRGAVAETVREVRKSLHPLFISLDDEPADGPDLETLYEDLRARHSDRLERTDEYFRFRIADLPDANVDELESDDWIHALVVEPSVAASEARKASRALGEIRRIVSAHPIFEQDPGVTFLLGGGYTRTVDEMSRGLTDLRRVGVIGFVALGVVLMVLFRGLWGLMIVLLPLVPAMAWTFGILGFVHPRMHSSSITMSVMLLGLGVDFTIHLYSRFRQEQVDRPGGAAVREAFRHTWHANVIAGLTTAAGFATFLISDYRGFRELGTIIPLGILCCLAATWTVFPVVVAAMSERSKSRRLLGASWLVRAGSIPKPLAAGLALLVLPLAVIGIGRLELEADHQRLVRETPERAAAARFLPNALGVTHLPAGMIVPDETSMREATHELERRARETDSLIHAVVSLANVVPPGLEEKAELVRDLRELLSAKWMKRLGDELPEQLRRLRELSGTEPWSAAELPDEVRDGLFARDGRPLVLVYPRVLLTHLDRSTRFAAELADIPTSAGRFTATNDMLVMGEVELVMMESAPKAVLLASAVVLLLLAASMRRLTDTLLVVIPAALGTCGALGAWGLLGGRLNLLNVVMIPAVLGVAIDDGVHLIQRWRELGRSRVAEVMRSSGWSVCATTATTCAGFGALALADQVAIGSMGTLALVGLCGAFVATIVLLPALMRRGPSVQDVQLEGGAAAQQPVAEAPEVPSVSRV